jgi:hypothetical protein
MSSSSEADDDRAAGADRRRGIRLEGLVKSFATPTRRAGSRARRAPGLVLGDQDADHLAGTHAVEAGVIDPA